MDIFNKKKVKSLEWDVMALKARLESKESELERINKNLFRMYDDIAAAFLSQYENKIQLSLAKSLKAKLQLNIMSLGKKC